MPLASEIGSAGKFEKCLVNGLEEAPRQILAGFIQVPGKLACDIGLKQWGLFDREIHPRLSRMTCSHAARISSDE